MKLYEISNELLAMAAQIAETGEMTPELEAKFDAIQGERRVKQRNIYRLIKQCRANATASKGAAAPFKEEYDTLMTLAKREDAVADKLETYLLEEMKRIGETEVKETDFRLLRMATPLKVTKLPETVLDLPLEYRRITMEADKAALLQAFKDGKELPPGVVVEPGERLKLS